MKAPDFAAIGSFLRKTPEILFAYAFGSQVSGTASALSDLDLAVYARPPLSDEALRSLQTELMETARSKEIDLVDLRLAPPVLAYEVATSGRLLFTKDVAASNRFESRALLLHFDTQHLRNVQDRYLRERLHGAVKERLKALSETLERLTQLKKAPFEDFLGDYRNLWSAEHGLRIAAESLFDIGGHILAGHFRAAPKDYEDITRLLSERKVIQPELALRLKGLGGFRNIIVHDYLEIDPAKVYDRLQRGLPDFEEFARQVLSWLDRR